MLRVRTIGRVVLTSLFVVKVKHLCHMRAQKVSVVMCCCGSSTLFCFVLNDIANAADIVAIDSVASSIVSIHNGFLLRCKMQSDLTQWC